MTRLLATIAGWGFKAMTIVVLCWLYIAIGIIGIAILGAPLWALLWLSYNWPLR